MLGKMEGVAAARGYDPAVDNTVILRKKVSPEAVLVMIIRNCSFKVKISLGFRGETNLTK